MRKLTLADVKNLHEYELIRDDWRGAVIEAKVRRRVLLGSKMSLVFENRLTVLNQIQEMCRSERIVKPEKVQEEIDVYNELLPEAGEVGATLFVEITKEAEIQRELDGLIGLDDGRSLWIELGERRAYAAFLGGQGRSDRIAAVQYIKFPVGDARAELESAETSVVLRVSHPGYEASARLSPETRAELALDLSGD